MISLKLLPVSGALESSQVGPRAYVAEEALNKAGSVRGSVGGGGQAGAYGSKRSSEEGNI